MHKPAFYLAAALVALLLAASATTSILFLTKAQGARAQLFTLERGQAMMNRRLAELSAELRLAESSRAGLPSPTARAGSAPPTAPAPAALQAASAPRPVPRSRTLEAPAVSLPGSLPRVHPVAGRPLESLAAAAFAPPAALPAPLPAAGGADAPAPLPPESAAPGLAPPEPQPPPAAASGAAGSRISASPAPASLPPAAPVPAAQRCPPEADLALQRELARGLQCYEQARYAEGIASFAAVLALQPENMQARRYYATCLYRANPGDSLRYGEIEWHLRQVLLEQPQDAEALEVSGRLRAERECWSDALGFFQRALELRPEDPEYARMAGLCALYGGDAEGAEGYFLKACFLNGEAAEPWQLLGLARERAGRLEEAVAGYLRCLELEPGRLQARLRAGLVLLKLGRNPEAREQLQAHVRGRPGVAGLTALGDCLLALGEVEGAEGCWREALERATLFGQQERRAAAEVYLRLSRAAWQHGDAGQSLALAEQGLLCSPLPLLSAFRGLGCLSTGQPARGRVLLREVLGRYPGTEAAALAAEALGRGPP
jgi:tetratricopeptide (TPR) repeat protein